ncbi:MAG: precorrin-8X methylmutase [Acidimicrobiales bacterium]|jgi:precorrin isomerase
MSRSTPPSELHPIEEESFRRLAERIDLRGLPPLTRQVVGRVIHATADLAFAETMVVDETGAAAAARALAEGAPVITDVEMVRAGIRGAECFLDQARSERERRDPAAQPDPSLTLSARAIQLAAKAHPDGAIFAIGCAPTALEQLVSLIEKGEVRPVLVVGVPVGFVGAAESKERLRQSASNIASISNIGERGGSAVAAAVVNALARMR